MSSEGQTEARTPAAYRLAPRRELAPLADLWVASWQATLPAIDFAARRDWFCAHVADIERRGGVTLCAHDLQAAPDNPALGFILLDVAQGVLEQIAVTPQRFNSGLGAFLLEHAKALCPAGLGLAVNADNPHALRFYEKHGFARVGSAANPLSGLPIWHMRWSGR